MPDYRDELRAAHERIAQLEGRLAAPPPAPPRRRPVFRFVVSTSILLVVAAAFIRTAIHPDQRGTSPPSVAYPAVPTRTPVFASWYPQAGVGPSFVDIDGDGKKDLVALAWSAGHPAAALHVVAFDRKTYDVKWAAGPFPSQWNGELTHLVVVVGDRVVVTDSQAMAHVIDVHDGSELSTEALPKAARSACAAQDGSQLVVFDADKGKEASVLDLTTGTRSPPRPANGVACATRGTAESNTINAKVKTKGFWTKEVLADQDDRVTTGFAPGEGGPVETAVGWDFPTKTVNWEKKVIPADIHDGRAGSQLRALAKGRFFMVYQSTTGVFRLVARSAKTGSLLYTRDIPLTAEGSTMTSLTTDGDDVFIVADQTLHVVDASDGMFTRRLASF